MTNDGNFLRLLQDNKDLPQITGSPAPASATRPLDTHGTTVIAMRYDKGVVNIGDRRATADNMVMYDRAEKILALDDYTLLAISGSFARAMEIVHYLKHAFKYYRRTQLQELSLEGKVSEVSRAIAGNLPSALQGIGVFLPVMSAFDPSLREGRIFFYDGMGARFESAEFGAAGSGSVRIHGVFEYIMKTRGPFREMPFEVALAEGLRLLEIAASLDVYTGGYEHVPPVVKTVSAEGITTLTDEQVLEAIARQGK
jgi:proteasome beta subunit